MRADHQLHIAAGYLINIIFSFAFQLVTPGLLPILLGFAVGAAAGAAKEVIWDYMLKKGNPERKDFYFTVAGSAAATIPQLIQFL